MSLEKYITDIKHIFEITYIKEWSVKEIEKDLMALGSIQDHEEAWIFVLKGDDLIHKGGYSMGTGKKWDTPLTNNLKKFFGMKSYRRYGVAVDREEVASAVMSSGADTVLIAHNHPDSGTPQLSLPPSDGDYLSAKNFDEYFKSYGLNIRFFVVGTYGLLEFDGSGIINKSRYTRVPDTHNGRDIGVLP